MKIHTLLIIVVFIASCSSDEEELPFYIAENGVIHRLKETRIEIIKENAS